MRKYQREYQAYVEIERKKPDKSANGDICVTMHLFNRHCETLLRIAQ